MKIVLGLGTIGVLGQVDLGESSDIQRITEKRYQQETFPLNPPTTEMGRNVPHNCKISQIPPSCITWSKN